MSINSISGAACAALASMGVTLVPAHSAHEQPRRPAPIQRRKQSKLWGFNPRINHWTGEPHQHRREKARRNTPPGTDARRMAMQAAKEG